jgi:ABC-2 type transport system permease protein
MVLHRIWAMILRYLYTTRDPTRITEFIFWPAIDIGFLGLLGFWVGSSGNELSHIVSAIVSGLILWQVTFRAHFEIAVNVIDEFWEQNLVNLIATPLKNSEWIFSMMFSGFLKAIFTLLFGGLVGWLFFKVNIFNLGWQLVPFICLCILSGWAIGFLAAGIIIYKGPRLSQLPWVVITIAALFSTIYYPLSILPGWMQTIALWFPMTYVFEGMRELLTTGSITTHYLAMSLLLNGVYLLTSIGFFLLMFEASRKKGLSRLTF